MTDYVIEVEQLSKSFKTGQQALHAVNLHVAAGEMVALLGASGSGKSTLLRHLAGFVAGDSGRIAVNGHVIQQQGRISRQVRAARAQIGFIFQQFNLVGPLSVMTNVLTGRLPHMPLWRSLPRWFQQHELALGLDALQRVGMGDYAFQRASTLSGGQQQRAAIARALVQNARVILADEPIASLDPSAARRVMETLARINREQGVAVVVSLHQVDVALRYCPRVVALRAGQIAYDGPASALTPAMLHALYGEELEQLIPQTPTPAPAQSPSAPEGTPVFGLPLAA